MKKTPWLSVKTPPVRPGWYEYYDSLWCIEDRIEYTGEYWRNPWDGSAWNTHPKDKWRGLTYHEYMRLKNDNT